MKFKFLILVLIVVLVILYRTLKSGYENTEFSDLLYNRFKYKFDKYPGNEKLSGVDMVYAITMPQRKDYITSQMNNLGITFTYFNAITPQDLKPEEYDNISYTNKEGSRIYKRYTRLPVLLSFILCFIDAVKKGYSTIVIFEDDISILVDKKLLNESLLEFKNSNMDAFYMGYCFLNCGQNVTKYKNIVKLSNPDIICGHSMAIKTKILPGLINYCFPMTTASDELFREYYIKNKINVCVPKNAYFIQNRESLGSLNESGPDPELFKTCKF
uniref:Glycosyl transferase family 25 domain-containing protein n=1 Tax=viral metagenome TaxID=1070528 RepID=A0A6C0B0P2_9ZZZZ